MPYKKPLILGGQASVTGLGLSIPFASSSRRIVLLSGVGAWPPPDGI